MVPDVLSAWLKHLALAGPLAVDEAVFVRIVEKLHGLSDWRTLSK
jgi:hypothetical protein